MKKLTKVDAEYISKRFYDFYDKVWEVVKEMTNIKDKIEKLATEEVSLNHYCIARHNKNIIVANFYAHRCNEEVQFPLHYLYDKDWQSKYRDELIKEKERIRKSREDYKTNRDLDEIKRLKEIYPEKFI